MQFLWLQVCVSLSAPFIDDIAAKTGIEVTFFYNDTRLVTSLKDADGKRILGSKAGDFLVENVLQDGNEVFTNRVLVDGTFKKIPSGNSKIGRSESFQLSLILYDERSEPKWI